jgi:predicted RNA-binding protein YlxR (DUF448 family)
MAAALARDKEQSSGEGTSRRCIATGDIRPTSGLLRFVIGPEGQLVPDIDGRLPGRGLWLTARRDILAQAVAKRLFARAARGPVIIADGLADQIEAQLAGRCGNLLSLARRAGQAVAGFVKVRQALEGGKAAVLVAASDGAADGRGKLAALAPGRPQVSLLTSAELGAAFGREQVVHAAVMPGRLAKLLVAEAGRLAGFRSLRTIDGNDEGAPALSSKNGGSV